MCNESTVLDRVAVICAGVSAGKTKTLMVLRGRALKQRCAVHMNIDYIVHE